MSRAPALPSWRRVPVLSGRAARRILTAPPGSLQVSLDLGRSQCIVSIGPSSAVLPDGQQVPKDALADAFSDPSDCIAVERGKCNKVYIYSESERKYYKLYQPFEGRPPTVIINNATMHAIVHKDPWQDEADKVAALPRRGGECLDTCSGLGYSAQILFQGGFARVVTCEVDANVLEVATVNPWSQGLFENPRITIVRADVRELVSSCPAERFTCVFHDPPTVFQAGELYSEDLYGQFARVLKSGGALYHYVGAPGARVGRDHVRGVIRRLQAAGFGRVRRVAGGVLATRER